MSTWTVSKTLAEGELFITPSTESITDTEVVLTVTTTGNTTCMPQYSTDGGSSWTDLSTYTVNVSTDHRSVSASGLLRVVFTNDGSGSNTVSLTITSTGLTGGGVTPEDVYRTAGISSDIISRSDTVSAILRAESEARLITGRPLSTETVTEYHWGNNKKSLFVKYTPIVSLDSLAIGSDSVSTSEVDVVSETGMLILKSSAEVARFTLPSEETPSTSARNVTVKYTYGVNTPLYWMKRLVECLAAIIILAEQTGGTYDDVTSYTIGSISASLGEPYTNIRQTVSYLDKEINGIIVRFAKKRPAVF